MAVSKMLPNGHLLQTNGIESNLTNGQVRKNGRLLPLQPQARRILTFLASRPDDW